jgi:succinoglycan biosynthesis transport protein ExoP
MGSMTGETYTRSVDPEASPDVDIQRYLRGLVRRKFTILSVILIAVATAVAVSMLQSPKYEGNAEIVLQAKSGESLFNQSTPSATDPQVSVDTEIQVIESPPVRAAVIAKLGQVDKVAASRVGQTLVIAVKAYASRAPRAADVANAYATAYLDLAKQRAADDLLQAGRQLQTQITSLQTQIDALDGRLVNAPLSQQSALTATRTSLSAQQDTFRQRLGELQVDASLASGGAQLVASASPPRAPVQPTPVRNVILAIMVGLFVGVAVACLTEYLDDTIRTAEDLERFRPFPVLARIPSFGDRPKRGVPPLALDAGRSTAASEAYRTLRTAVQLLGVIRPLTVIQFTSPTPGEGKTTTVVNLATVLADAGRQVVVVDCDMRRPLVHQTFGLDNEVGLTSVLVGDVSVSEALRAVPGFERLFVLTAGGLAPNPSELLSLKQTSEIVFALQSRFDFVLLDSPPVLPVTDSVVLSEWVEAIVIVTASGVTRRKALHRAIQLLEQTAAPIEGLVLNRARPEAGYTYTYQHDQGKPQRSTSPSRGEMRAPKPHLSGPLPAAADAPTATNGGPARRSKPAHRK